MSNNVWAIVPQETNIFHEYENGYVPALFATKELADKYLTELSEENRTFDGEYEVVSVYVEGLGN